MPGDRNPSAPNLERWLKQYADFLRIESISADPAKEGEVLRAAEWVRDLIRSEGGTADLVPTRRAPLVVGGFSASDASASGKTSVLLYAHFDVQPPGDENEWDTPPFEPTVRDGCIYARGASDDKANLYIMLRACAELLRLGRLPVNVRIVCDGEEESIGDTVVDWVHSDTGPVDVAIVLDGLMKSPSVPMFTVGTRGLLQYRIRATTADRDLHSGLFGGVALNAAHALQTALAPVLANPDDLAIGATPIEDDVIAAWSAQDDGAAELALVGGRPRSTRVVHDFHRHAFARPSVDVNGFSSGEVHLDKTIIPASATANVSVRLVPGQEPDTVDEAFQRIVRGSAPSGCDLTIERRSGAAGSLTDIDHVLVHAVARAFERVVGQAPVMLPTGGSVPIMAALDARGIPTIHTGFGLLDDCMHAPNERFRLANLELGVRCMEAALVACADAAETSPLSQPIDGID